MAYKVCSLVRRNALSSKLVQYLLFRFFDKTLSTYIYHQSAKPRPDSVSTPDKTHL